MRRLAVNTPPPSIMLLLHSVTLRTCLHRHVYTRAPANSSVYGATQHTIPPASNLLTKGLAQPSALYTDPGCKRTQHNLPHQHTHETRLLSQQRVHSTVYIRPLLLAHSLPNNFDRPPAVLLLAKAAFVALHAKAWQHPCVETQLAR